MAMGKRVALITGATGIQGRTLAKKLGSSPNWEKVYGVSRHKLEGKEFEKVTHLALDLTDRQAVEGKLKEAGVKDVTHLFHVAFGGDQTNMDLKQLDTMKNTIEALEAIGNKLDHVHFTEGNKYYGVHLGKDFDTPFREDMPRHMPPNFYFAYEDYVNKRVAEGASWKWSSTRPGAIIGFAPRTYMSLLQCFAIYGTFARELSMPLRFPGTARCYNSVFDCVDVDLLADAQIWLATHPEAANQAYNINNGDTFRWRQVWPKIAEWFGVSEGPLLSQPVTMLLSTPDKEVLWDNTVKKYGLQPLSYKDVVQWNFMEVWLQFPDAFEVTTKLARAGFPGMTRDSDAVFVLKLQELADNKIIPDYPKERAKEAKEQKSADTQEKQTQGKAIET